VPGKNKMKSQNIYNHAAAVAHKNPGREERNLNVYAFENILVP